MVGEARDLSPRLVRAESLVPVRDATTDSVFQGCAIHRPIEEPSAVVQPPGQAKAESVKSFEAEAKQEEGNMVTRRALTVDRFILGAHPPTQQQQAPSRDPHPLPTRTWKRQCTADPPRT